MSRQIAAAWATSALLTLAVSCRGPVAERPAAEIAISVPWEIETLDPHASGSEGGLTIAEHFYEPLVETDASMRLRPALAESWENPDPSTWTFHLRPGVRFHSGKRLDAGDVVWSIERLRAGRAFELGTYVQDIADATAVDAATVRLRTRQPATILLAKLQYVFIVPRGVGEGALEDRENGTGPFRLERWTKGSTLTMRAFPAYWRRRPALERATFRLRRPPEAAAKDFEAGRSQLGQCDESCPSDGSARAHDARIVRQSSLLVSYLAFDTADENARFCSVRPNPFRKPEVRRAVDLAIDRARLAARLGARPATQCVAPSIFGYDPALVPTRFDPVEARRALAAAGYPEGFRVTLHTRPMFAESARVVAEMLGSARIAVDVRVLADEDFWALAAGHGATLLLDRYACQTGDASEALEQLVHSADPGRRFGEANAGGYANPAIDVEIDRSMSEPDVARRNTMLREVMREVAEDRPLVPLVVEEQAFAIRREFRWRPRENASIRVAEISLVREPEEP